MDPFLRAPFLAILEKRKDLLPDPSSIGSELLERAKKHLHHILYAKKKAFVDTHPALFFVEANMVAFSPSERLWELFAKYYADLALPVAEHPLFLKHYPRQPAVPLKQFLPLPRPYPQLRLYHLPLREGVVYLGDREPLFRLSRLYADILYWIREKVRRVVMSGALEGIRDAALEAVAPPIKKKRGYAFIQRLIAASGIPDGRKRILLYWLIPYWVTVEGRSPEEVLQLANEWLSRQGGGRIYSSWILSDAENVRSKGIRPWSLKKVMKEDPQLVEILKGMGLL